MNDPRLDPTIVHPFFAKVDEEGVEAITEDARLFVGEMYFRDRAWVYEPIVAKSPIGASVGIVDYQRYPTTLGVHVRRITARYANDIGMDTFSGATDGAFVSERESELVFPLGSVIEVGDKVLVVAKGRKPERWFTIVAVDDISSDALYVVTRGESIGVPDGIANT